MAILFYKEIWGGEGLGCVLFCFVFGDTCLDASNSLFTVLTPFLLIRNASQELDFTKAKVRKVCVAYHEALKTSIYENLLWIL